MKTIKPINFQELLTELATQPNMSDAKIGKIVDKSASTITRLRTGTQKTTEANLGFRICNLHARTFKRKS